jgi:hypothetical protein
LGSSRAWDQERDTERVRQAFTALLRNSTAWPSPAKFLEVLPAQRDVWRALPKHTNADPAKVRAIFDELGKRLGVTRG